MSALLDRGRSDVARTASEYARETLSMAVRDALEEADVGRAKRARRRGWMTTIAGLGVGGAIGYLLRSGDLEAAMEEADLEVDVTAPESVGPMATEEPGGRTSGLGRKLLAAGGLVLGVYLLRRRASGPREMVREARQRTGGEAGRGGATGRGETGAGTGPAAQQTGATGGERATVGEGTEEPTVETERGVGSAGGDEEPTTIGTVGEDGEGSEGEAGEEAEGDEGATDEEDEDEGGF